MDVSRHSEPKKNFSHQDISDCGGSVIDKRKGLNPLDKVIAYDYTGVPSVVISGKLEYRMQYVPLVDQWVLDEVLIFEVWAEDFGSDPYCTVCTKG